MNLDKNKPRIRTLLLVCAVFLASSSCVLSRIKQGPEWKPEKSENRKEVGYELLVLAEPCLRNSFGTPTGRAFLFNKAIRDRVRESKDITCLEYAPRDWYPLGLVMSHQPALYYLARFERDNRVNLDKLPQREPKNLRKIAKIFVNLRDNFINSDTAVLKYEPVLEMQDYAALRAVPKNFLFLKILGTHDPFHISSCLTFMSLLVIPGILETKVILIAEYFNEQGVKTQSVSAGFEEKSFRSTELIQRGLGKEGTGSSKKTDYYDPPVFRTWWWWGLLIWGPLISHSEEEFHQQTVIKAYQQLKGKAR